MIRNLYLGLYTECRVHINPISDNPTAHLEGGLVVGKISAGRFCSFLNFMSWPCDLMLRSTDSHVPVFMLA